MLFTCLGRSVKGKTVPLVLSTALGLRHRAVLKTAGTVFPIRTSRPVNNIIIYLIYLFLFLFLFSFARKLYRVHLQGAVHPYTLISLNRNWNTQDSAKLCALTCSVIPRHIFIRIRRGTSLDVFAFLNILHPPFPHPISCPLTFTASVFFGFIRGALHFSELNFKQRAAY